MRNSNNECKHYEFLNEMNVKAPLTLTSILISPSLCKKQCKVYCQEYWLPSSTQDLN